MGVNRLREVRFVIADLEGSTLGHADSDLMYADQNAADYRWFTNALPTSNLAFGDRVSAYVFRANVDSPASDKVDLLTLLMHEMGHMVGLDALDIQEYPHVLMT